MKQIAILGAVLFLCGCHTDMWVQPKTSTFSPNAAFADGQSARPPVAGTVAYTAAPATSPFLTGIDGGRPVPRAPVEAARQVLNLPTLKSFLLRGEERFNVFCSPCHGRIGDGQGMIAARGLANVRQPRNFHSDKILTAPDGHLFQVITNGYGAMYSYCDRVPVADRWAIVAYIRALELSQGGNP